MSSDRKTLNSTLPKKTHYQTLGLQQNCTEKQVKAAFITLSKVHHPDLNLSDPSRNEKFVKIYEAYETLSRPERRNVYDSDLRYQEKLRQVYRDDLQVKTNAPRYRVWRDESIYSMRDKTSQDFNGDYYGIKGVKRVSNYWIAGGAVFVMMLGTLMHYTAFKHAGTFTVTQLDTRDERIARELFKVRRNAIKNSTDQQIEAMTHKFDWKKDTDEGVKQD